MGKRDLKFPARIFFTYLLGFLLLVILICTRRKIFLGISNQPDRYHSACNNIVFFNMYIIYKIVEMLCFMLVICFLCSAIFEKLNKSLILVSCTVSIIMRLM